MKLKIQAIKSIAIKSIFAVAIILITLLLVFTLNRAFPVGAPFYAELAVLVLFIAWLYISMILANIVYEIGHVIVGNALGYDFVAMGICGIWLIRKDDNYKLTIASQYGINHGTIMAPNGCENEYIPATIYNYSGILFCTTVTLISIISCLILNINEFIRLSLIILSLQNALVAISTIFTLIQNNGINAVYGIFNKSPESSEKTLRLIKIREYLTNGESLTQIEPDLFDASTNDIVDTIIKRLACQKLLYNKDFKIAKDEIDKLLQNSQKNSNFNYELTADYCVSKLILGEEFIPTKQFLKYVKSSKYDIPLIRTRYAIELLINKNEKSAQKLKKRFERITKNSPFAGTVSDEITLMETIDNVFADNN